jgi:phosphonate transport system substrate-binding protein
MFLSVKISLALLFFIAVTATAQPLRIATYQYSTNSRVQNLEPLAAYLAEQTGRPTEVKTYLNVPLLTEAIQKGEVDLAFINTFGFLLLETGTTSYPMKAVAALWAPDAAKDSYKTLIVAKRASRFDQWQQLSSNARNLKLSLVFPSSTSGNLVPRLAFNSIGIANADSSFHSVTYAGTHRAALQHLLQDSADIACMGSAEWDRLSEKERGALEIIWTSPDIPLGPALVADGLSAGLQAQIRALLLTLPKENPLVFHALKSAWTEGNAAVDFVPVTANYYEPFLQKFGSKESVHRIIDQFGR